MISLAKQDGVITIVIMQEKNDIMSACMALSRMILYAHLRGKHDISRGNLMWVRGIYESPREVHQNFNGFPRMCVSAAALLPPLGILLPRMAMTTVKKLPLS